MISFIKYLFDWRISTEELDYQIKNYKNLDFFHSYRKIAALILFLIFIVNFFADNSYYDLILIPFVFFI